MHSHSLLGFLIILGVAVVALRNEVGTSLVDDRPITVDLGDLPSPYATRSARKFPQIIAIPSNAILAVPPRFRVQVYASNLDRPRWLCRTPDGRVLVTETRRNRIRLLTDADGDGVVDRVTTFADSGNGVDIPFGMAFVPTGDGGHSFVLGNSDEVRSYNLTSAAVRRLSGRGVRLTTLPGGGYHQHWTRNVVLSPEGDRLFVSVGSKTNAREEALPRASIQIMDIDGANRRTFAHGLRNAVGIDFHPISGELYTTVNERDGLGDNLVPDFFTRVREGEFFGWPYVYLSANLTDPRHRSHANESLTNRTVTPDVLFQSHSAALGLQFYNGTQFPAKYRNGAFVAFRGSWNRDAGTGFKIVFVPFDEATHRPMGYYEDFVTGFLTDPLGPTTWGRPVGLLVLDDGSMLFTEELRVNRRWK